MLTQAIVCHFELISLAIGALEKFWFTATRSHHPRMHEPTLVIQVVIYWLFSRRQRIASLSAEYTYNQ